MITRIAIVAALLGATPALAASPREVRSADRSVAAREVAVKKAERTGDAATIASERAALKAAQAVAWGKRQASVEPVNTAAR